MTAPAPCISCTSRDLQHSMSSLKQQGEQVRLDGDVERQEHERDYVPWDEARITVSWMGWGGVRKDRGFVMAVRLGKVSYAWTSTRDKVSHVRKMGDT